MPVWLKDLAFTNASSGKIVLDDVIRDPNRLGRDRQPGVHRRGRGEERRVDDEEILDVVGAAERIEDGGTPIRAETERPALVGRVPLAMRVLHHDPETQPLQDPLRLRDQHAVLDDVVWTLLQANASV